MELYQETLQKVAQKEIATAIFWVVVILLVVAIVWVSNYRFFKKKGNSQKQVKMRRQSIWASVALTVICVGFATLLLLNAANTVFDIHQDMEENAYITYVDGYRVTSSGYHSRTTLYDQWITVDFDNGDYGFLYMDSFFEWLTTEEGLFEGTVVYGKNSLIVVEITK